MAARCAEGTQGAQSGIKWVARCMERVHAEGYRMVARYTEGLLGVWRGHSVVARCMGSMQRMCGGMLNG